MAKKILNFKTKTTEKAYFFASLASGILMGTSYIPFPAWAAFFCYVPLWLIADKLITENQSQSLYRKIFLGGWITQFTLTLIGFNWIFYTAKVFGELHWTLAAGALFLFAALVHIYIPLSLLFAAWAKKRYQLSSLSFFILAALSLSLIERIWPMIFEWHIGYTILWMKWPAAQWADTVGFYGLSAFILLTQAFLSYIIYLFFKNKKLFYQDGLIVLFAMTAFWGLAFFTGSKKQIEWQKIQQSKNLSQVANFTIAQANIGNEEKMQSELGAQFQPAILEKYSQLVEDFFLKKRTEYNTDFILWPETAMPFAIDQHLFHMPLVKNLLTNVKKWNALLLTGGYSQDAVKKDHLGYLVVRNSIFFLNGSGFSQPPYYKTHLLIFGEYMPLGETFPFLYKLLPFVGAYERGPGPVTKEVTLSQERRVKLGPQICYESLSPEFSRQLANQGSQIIFNVTNDSWFGSWAEPYQHMIMTLARAIEVRRPLVRSTNTGISTVMLADGTQLEASPIQETWVGSYNVPYQNKPEKTLFSRWGYLDWVVWLLLSVLILIKGYYATNKKS